MTDEFLYVETRSSASRISLQRLVKELQEAVGTDSKSDLHKLAHSHAFWVRQSAIKDSDPENPWNLVPRFVEDIKNAIYKTSGSVPLEKITDFRQGVTPGGGALRIFLISRSVASSLERAMVRPAIEASDIIGWQVTSKNKFLIYPYLSERQAVNLGHLDHALTDQQAHEEIDKRFARGEIDYPRTARYLSQYFVSLAQRAFEKKTLAEHHREWYEYWRSREPEVQTSAPKIVTRRMTRDVQFALDRGGVLSTDGVELLLPKPGNPLARAFQAHREEINSADWLLYLIAILNSSVVKFLLKSTSDFWQGNYYAVRKDFLKTIPIPLPRRHNVMLIRKVVKEANRIVKGNKDGRKADKFVFDLFDQSESRDSISAYLSLKS